MAVIDEKLSFTRRDVDGNEIRFYPETKTKFVTDDNGKSIAELLNGGGSGGWDGYLADYVTLTNPNDMSGVYKVYQYDLMQAGELPRYVWAKNSYSGSSTKGCEMQIAFTVNAEDNAYTGAILSSTVSSTSYDAVEHIVPVPKAAKYVLVTVRGSSSNMSSTTVKCRAYF